MKLEAILSYGMQVQSNGERGKNISIRKLIFVAVVVFASLAAQQISAFEVDPGGLKPCLATQFSTMMSLARIEMPGRSAVAGIESSPEGKFAVLASDKPKTAARILIAYFSRVGTSKSFAGADAVSSASLPQGNTIVIAKMIHDVVDGDMFQIVTVNPYPADYHETTVVARREQDDNARPKLSTHVAHIDDYDTIFLGYPIWWGRMPMAILSFLEEYNLSGKTIIPFCTNGGSGLGSTEKEIAALCPRSLLLRGLAIPGSSASLAQNQVSDWLAELGYR